MSEPTSPMESHEAEGGSGATQRTTIYMEPGQRGKVELLLVNMEEMMKTMEPGDVLESDPFVVGRNQFDVTVFPNQRNRGKVGVVLGNRGDEDVIVRSFKCTIGNDSRERTDVTVPAVQGAGWDWFNSHNDCKKALVDGALLVKAEVEMRGKRVVTSSSTGHNLEAKNHCASDIKSLLFNTEYSDFVLKCDGKSFPCHRNILCARSSLFERMLAPTRGWDEAKKGEATIEEVKPEILEMMIEFIYSGEVAAMEGRAMELLYAADKYGLEDLVKVCAAECRAEVTPATAARILLLADKHCLCDLKQVVVHKFMSDKATYLANAVFKEEMMERPDLMYELLGL